MKYAGSFHISTLNKIVGTCKNRLGEMVLKSSHNLCFWAEIRKLMYTPINSSFAV